MASGFLNKYLSEVESGKGLIGGARAAGKGTMKDIKKDLSKEELKKTAVRTLFGGDDILSAALRGKFGVKKKEKKEKGATPVSSAGESIISSEGISFIKIIAKNSMSLPGMARDMNVMRQNVQKLVKLKAGPQKKGKKAYAEGADAFFLREDERERALEAQRGKVEGKPTAATPGAGDKEGGILDSIIKFFSGGFTNAIKSLFNPKTLMKVFTKVFLPLAIIGTLFSGIMDGFKRYQETGNLGDAIVSGLGGMLKFVTFGLFGEDTLKSLFDSISSFFQPITDTISGIFTGIKDFVKGLFGGKVDVKDDAPAKADSVKPTMPDPAKFASSAAKASGASDEKSADLGGLFGAVGKGDVGGLFAKAQEFAAKYPEPPPTETTPEPVTKEGIPLEQAQRNYELNKALTGEASKALGTPLEMPAAPTPATPPAPVQSAPTPAPEMSDADKVKQLEGYIEGNKKRFARREEDAARHIASFKRRYANDPSRVKELEDEYKQTLDVERKEMEEANAGFQRQIDFIKNSGRGAPSPAPSSAPAAAATPAAGSGATGGAVSSASAAPSPMNAQPPSSGSSLSDASSQVAEAQRMESSADVGSVVNSPTTNNSSSSPGKEPAIIADAYDSEFAKLLTA